MALQSEVAFWAQVDRHAVDAQQLVPRLSFAKVTDAASTFSYSIQYNASQDPVSGVDRLCAQVPIVGDLVAVTNIDGIQMIIGVRGRGPIRQASVTTSNAATGSTTYVTSGTGTDSISQDLVSGQTVFVAIAAKMSNSVGTTDAAQLSFRVTGPGATYGPTDDDGPESDLTLGTTLGKITLFTAPATGTHTFTLMYRAINAGTANYWNRRIAIWE